MGLHIFDPDDICTDLHLTPALQFGFPCLQMSHTPFYDSDTSQYASNASKANKASEPPTPLSFKNLSMHIYHDPKAWFTDVCDQLRPPAPRRPGREVPGWEGAGPGASSTTTTVSNMGATYEDILMAHEEAGVAEEEYTRTTCSSIRLGPGQVNNLSPEK